MQTFSIPTFVINSSMNIGNNVKVPSKNESVEGEKNEEVGLSYYISPSPGCTYNERRGKQKMRS